jgi:aspartate dehydrogenase
LTVVIKRINLTHIIPFSLLDWHLVKVEVTGPTKNCDFTVETVRRNPADPGAVTGSATYASFFSLLLRAKDKGQGMHLH